MNKIGAPGRLFEWYQGLAAGDVESGQAKLGIITKSNGTRMREKRRRRHGKNMGSQARQTAAYVGKQQQSPVYGTKKDGGKGVCFGSGFLLSASGQLENEATCHVHKNVWRHDLVLPHH